MLPTRRSAKAVHHAADGGEPLQVLAEIIGVRRNGVQRGQRIRNAVLRRLLQADILPQKLSRRNAIVILSVTSGVA